MMDKEQIARSQGIKVSSLERKSEPRNRIEEALMPVLKKPEPALPEPPKKESFQRARTALLALALLTLLAALGYGSHLIYKRYANMRSDDPAAVLKEVGALTDLPEGEEPTVATITDLEPLRGEAFFQKAEVGDKVIVYTASKKAILYRPSEHKVIIVAPVR